MKYFFSLRIQVQSKDQSNKVTEVLGVNHDFVSSDWIYELPVPGNGYIDFIDEFFKILDNKFDLLETIGVKRDDISIWMIYEYDDQCNMEFSPQQMMRLSDVGLTLCVSCYQS